MGAKDARPEEVRVQVASIMRLAQDIVGSREKLAQRLGVEPQLVGEWISRDSDAPDDAVHEAAEVILEFRKRQSQVKSA